MCHRLVLSLYHYHPQLQAFAIWVEIWHLKYHGQFVVRPREIWEKIFTKLVLIPNPRFR